MAEERYVTETELVEWFRRRMLGTAGYALAAKVILDWAEDRRKDQSRRLWTWFDLGGMWISDRRLIQKWFRRSDGSIQTTSVEYCTIEYDRDRERLKMGRVNDGVWQEEKPVYWCNG